MGTTKRGDDCENESKTNLLFSMRKQFGWLGE